MGLEGSRERWGGEGSVGGEKRGGRKEWERGREGVLKKCQP